MDVSTTAILWIILLVLLVVVQANYEFTIHFHEFRNPLGLQCGECENGGAPACCDDLQRTTNCIQEAPFTCDTRFRFQLRPYGATVETAPTRGFPHYTPSNGGNNDTFKEGPGGFLALSNPFTITSEQEWSGRIQFFIDALDKAVPNHHEVEAIINRFPIDIQLELGANFTRRRTYTGIYNYSIPSQEFDLSFKVQCSENFYGSTCAEFCEPILGVYEGRAVCVRNSTTDGKIPSQVIISHQESSASVIVLGTFFGMSVIINIILIIVVIIQRRNSKHSHSQSATDRAHVHPDMTNNEHEGSDLGSPDKQPQEAIYYVYENVASGTPLLNQGAYDYTDS